MSFDAGTVERVRDALDRLGERGAREKRVFGGWGFLQGKSTFVIVWGDGIIAKMPSHAYDRALTRPGISPFAPDGERPMGTWVIVAADAVADDPELAEWVALALQGVRQPPAAKRGTRRSVKR
ncbi:MAG: TfoX/Sxy family protein [Gemmatimonadaceae bacterium]|nr:TfoX/Sxy family protein [Gemmatimonadaceae bacterium]